MGKLIRAHYLAQEGKCPMMGDITGYRFRNTYDTYLEFDTEGNFVQAAAGCPPEPQATASIKGQTLAVTPR